MMTRGSFNRLATICLCFMLAACVSSTLDKTSLQDGSQSLAPAQPDETATSSEPMALAAEDAPEATPSPAEAQQGVAGQETPLGRPRDDNARKEAIAQMRAKGEAATSQPPSVFDRVEPATRQMTAEEQAALVAEMQALGAGEEGSEAELAERQRTIELLKKKAGSHYKDALKSIEN